MREPGTDEELRILGFSVKYKEKGLTGKLRG